MKGAKFHNIFHKVTYEMLRKNKMRTIVTIIGIILSTALVTAITTFISSLSNSMIEFKISEQGNWHGAIYAVDDVTRNEIKNAPDVLKTMELYNLGYSPIEEPKSEYTTHIGVFSANMDFMNEMSVNVTEGRLPENSSEIILPDDICKNYAQQYPLNGTMELNLSYPVTENNGSISYLNQYKKKTSETVDQNYKKQAGKQYKIVGFYKRLNYENDFDYKSYNGLTLFNDSQSYYDCNVFYRLGHTDKVEAFNKSYQDRFLTGFHQQLLILMGSSKYTSYTSMIYGLALIVIVLVSIGSILLIYNSFAISISERTRQYGLLSSIGATKKQLRQSILFESFFVSAIGIPIGVIVGITGIGITLLCIRGSLNRMAASFVSIGKMHLHVSWLSIVVAIVVAILTVLISAFVPMIRISRITALDAIRQNSDIKIKKKNKFKTSKLFYRIFGFEGMIARKNFKRSHKKYRTTVISLIVSIVLFISASSLSGYLIRTAEGLYEIEQYQVTLGTRMEFDDPIITEMGQVSQIKRMGITKKIEGEADINDNLITDEYKKSSIVDRSKMQISLFVLDDATYLSYLKQLNLPKETFYNLSDPVLIGSARFRSVNKDSGKVTDIPMFSQDKFKMNVSFTDQKKYSQLQKDNADYINQLEEKSGGNQTYYDADNYKELADYYEQLRNKCLVNVGFQIGAMTNELPFSVHITQRNSSIQLFCAAGMLPQIQQNTGISTEYSEIYFDTEDHVAVADSLRKILRNHGLAESMVEDVAAELESQQSMLYIVRVFSYGFIIMMSLIATANVFNTISTNMILRRREFAMLKSVGMTKHGFNRMMYYECILYGSKALIIGIPISLLFTWWVYKEVSQVLTSTYVIPYQSILIAFISVFAIVLITMWYTKAKINQLNLIESIKNENV